MTATIDTPPTHIEYAPKDSKEVTSEVDALFGKLDKELFELLREISDTALSKTVKRE